MEYLDSVVKDEEECISVCGDESRDNVPDEIPLKLSSVWASQFKAYYRDFYEDVRRRARGLPWTTKLVALAEALKIRVISKGPPLKYFLLKPLQKYLSKLLGRFKSFRLTRQTVNADFLTRFFNDRTSPPSEVPDKWHSLDYEGATDNIDPRASEACVQALSECLCIPADIAEDFSRALTGHTIHHGTDKKSGVPKIRPQKWGQFMGSPMSFVVLCIINLSVIRRAYEFTVHRRVSLHRLPALVNGDDGLVRAPPAFQNIWKEVALVAGLIPSLGKVYVHSTYANINSTSYSWNFDESCFDFLPYVNMGLLMGYQRSTDKSSIADAFDKVDSRHASIGARHRILIESCPPALKLQVHMGFLRENFPLLKSFSNIPWYIPEQFGGLGLSPIISPDSDVDDLVYSTGIINSREYHFGPRPWELRAVEFLQLHPNTYRLSTLPTDVPIQVRSLWTRLIPYRNTRRAKTSYSMTSEDIGLMDVSTYYLVPSLVANSFQKDALMILHRNQRVWKSLQRRFDNP
jgi:hypothetical protein